MGEIVEMERAAAGSPKDESPRATKETAPYQFDRWNLGASARTARVVSVLSKSFPVSRAPFVTRQIIKLADGRYVLAEVNDDGEAHGLGAPVTMMDGFDLAQLVLDGDREAMTTPAVTQALALSLLALIGEGARMALPVARGAG